MPPEPRSHPDRRAATLATAESADPRPAPENGAFLVPGPGARDCRMDLKLLMWRARAAAQRSQAAAQHLDRFDPKTRPDLWAGTVQDGTARGFAAALEEAIDLAGAPPAPEPAEPGGPLANPEQPVQEFTGRELRRKKDLLVASGGPRVRFSRREGLLFVDRSSATNSPNCLRFEARRDHGTLDDFVADADERPRLFSAQFLQSVRYCAGPGGTRLELGGRLGRGPVGWPMTLTIAGAPTNAELRLTLRIETCPPDWRLRARFLGLRPEHLVHECEDVRDVVQSDAGGFVAFTLARPSAALLVDGEPVAVPAAARLGPLVHDFVLRSG